MSKIPEYIAVLLFLIAASGPTGYAAVSWLVHHDYVLLIAAGLVACVLVWLIYLLIVEIRHAARLS